MQRYILPINGKSFGLYQANGDFDACIEELRAGRLEIITAKELAEARMFCGTHSLISGKWTWVAENFNYLPNGDILVASKEYNPLLHFSSFAKVATEWDKKHKHFFLDENVVGFLQQGVGQGKVLLLKRKDISQKIPTNKFGKYEITSFLFGEKAGDYGLFLKEYGIKNIPLYAMNRQFCKSIGNAFSRPLWIHDLGRGSDSGINGADYFTCACCGNALAIHSSKRTR